jgi:NAD(P)-dependent dehydrogenase (short-subunit alcohol dehydrogenase family)
MTRTGPITSPGRTVLLTGAAGGVGQVLAEKFVAQGDRVVAVDRDAQGLDELAARLEVMTVVADVSSPDDVDAAVAAAGPVDVMVNNAAVVDRLGSAHEVDLQEWHTLLAVNLTAPFLFCRAVLPTMIERGAGIIVNVASITGLRGGRAGVAYTASKHGLVGLTTNIAATTGHLGVRCNSVCPGSIDTGMQVLGEVFASGRESLARDRRKPPPVPPQQIADVVLFLASDAAAAINGVALPADSGSLAY